MCKLILNFIFVVVSFNAFGQASADVANVEQVLKTTMQEMRASKSIAERKQILKNFLSGLDAETILLADATEVSEYSIRLYQLLGVAGPAGRLSCAEAPMQIQTLCSGKETTDRVKADIEIGKELIQLVCVDSASQESVKKICAK